MLAVAVAPTIQRDRGSCGPEQVEKQLRDGGGVQPAVGQIKLQAKES